MAKYGGSVYSWLLEQWENFSYLVNLMRELNIIHRKLLSQSVKFNEISLKSMRKSLNFAAKNSNIQTKVPYLMLWQGCLKILDGRLVLTGQHLIANGNRSPSISNCYTCTTRKIPFIDNEARNGGYVLEVIEQWTGFFFTIWSFSYTWGSANYNRL